ncbi:aldehyde dehydrogenase [Leucogyrophana mollusca]|uniref:Aldehyde dehydrogenase n=1 Tax=Leucogyrophana mollusca TaxID=85980 RepID=A0ACB8B3S3_9AGAM|nr:aldehyde dehydrogenase [Leucogyrophana mollusca]
MPSSSATVKLEYTLVDEIDKIYASLCHGFRSGKLKSIAYRKLQLLQLAYLLQDNIQRFKDAFAADLGRPSLETAFLELDSTISDCKIAYDGVEKWAKTEKAPFRINFTAFNPVIRKEPKGVVLIISPFNYPVWTAIGPMIGAIAAGNSVLLKPSELSSAVSGLIAELVPKYMDPDVVRVVLGAVPQATKLLQYPWGHILYTGSARVAKIVCAAAALTLSPVSVELGGKSPVVIDSKCDLMTAARRILWGKCVNAGQTCIAPDYILVPKEFEDTFVQALKDVHDEFYPNGTKGSSDFGHIVNAGHFARIKNLLDNTQGEIVFGGETNEAQLYIAPTVVKSVQKGDSLMSEELFGPVLPIVPVDNVDEAIEYINANDHPLALYVFSQDAAFKAKVFDNTQSGSAIANDVLVQCATDGLPFGGIGPSGSGYYGRKYTFDLFTHLRASLDSPSWLDRIFKSRYPPYTTKKEEFLRTALGVRLPARPSPASLSRYGAASVTNGYASHDVSTSRSRTTAL